MKKIIAFEWLSLDGFISDAKENTDWFVWDEEVAAYAKTVQARAGVLLFGKKTYEIMAGYWPVATADTEDPAIIRFMNESPKTVFSTTLTPGDPLVTGWGNTTIIQSIGPAVIKDIKKKAAGNILVYGSGSIVSQLMQLDLLDEYQLMINPIVLGSGKPLFQNLEEKFILDLKRAKKFKSGNTMLVYQPARKVANTP